MAIVEVDVDTDQFTTQDIIDEVSFRISSGKITAIEKITLLRALTVKEAPHNKTTLLDEQKNELFEEARERFTIAELTERLKP